MNNVYWSAPLAIALILWIADKFSFFRDAHGVSSLLKRAILIIVGAEAVKYGALFCFIFCSNTKNYPNHMSAYSQMLSSIGFALLALFLFFGTLIFLKKIGRKK